MKVIIESIKSLLDKGELKDNKWIFIKSKGDYIADYGDIDIFVIYEPSLNHNFYSVCKSVSQMATKLSLELKKYVSIFPIDKNQYENSNSQFMSNLRKYEVEL